MEKESEWTHVSVFVDFDDLHWSPARCSGSTCLDGQQLFIANLCDGVDHYSLPTMHRSQTYHHTILVNIPLQISVARKLGWVRVGGDNGFARVFNYQTGAFHEKLNHGSGVCFHS